MTNVPVNKGNYAMETAERERRFHDRLGEGWEDGYREYRTNWAGYPLRQHVSEYPLLVDLELSTVCNLKCRMCYTITDEFKKRVGAKFMDFGLFKKIMDEISGKVHAVRLSLRGEPTLHPKFIDCIRYAKMKGVKEISALTNGSNLSSDYFKEMMDAGIDWLTISVDGMDDNYEKIREPLKFKNTFERIRQIKAIKDGAHRTKPVIKIQALWPAIRENPGVFYSAFKPFVDLIAFNPLIDYLHKDSERDIAYEDKFLCPQHYQRLVIGSDGLALMCANDEMGSQVVGDAGKDTVYGIWHGEKMSKVRDIHKMDGGFLRLPACRRCYLPRLTDDKENAVVNGREFAVKNYVNRKREVGD